MRKNNLLKNIAVSATAISLVGATVGCAASGNAASRGTASVAETETSSESTESSEGEKILNVAITSVADVPFDPAQVPLPSYEQIQPLNDTLLHIDSDGNYTEGLADKWEYNDDFSSFTLHLRDGLTFHNGDPVTAEDVKFSLEYYGSEESNQADKFYFSSIFESIEVSDDQTVVVNFKEPFTEFEYLISEGGTGGGVVIPKKYFEEVGEEGFNKAPVGAGAFKFVSFTPGEKIEYEAFDEYWAGRAKIDRLILNQVSEENTLIAGLQTGEYDWANVGNDSVSILEASNIKVDKIDYSSTLGAFISGAYDGDKLPTQNEKVREALYTSIDRAGLVDFVFNGNATAADVWGVFPFTNGYNGQAEAIPYDEAAAVELLKEADYPNAFADPVVKLYFTEAKPYNKAVAQTLQSYWEKIGVQVELVTVDAVTLSGYYKADPLGEFEGAIFLFDPPKKYSANDAFAPFFPTKSTMRLIEGNDEFDKEVLNLSKTYGADRESTVTKVLDIIRDAHVAIPLVYPSKQYAVSDRVKTWDSSAAAHWGYYFYTFELN